MATNVEEQLSALVDGELTLREVNEVLASMRSRPELRERWARYHFISDGMHRNLPGRLPHDLQARVARALEREPVIVPPRRARRVTPRVKWAAGIVAACVAAAAIIGVRSLESPVQLPFIPKAPVEPVVTVGNDLAPYVVNHNESVSAAGYGMLPYVRLVSHDDAESGTE